MNNSQPKTGVDFKAKQLEFSAYIRDPVNNPAPNDVKKQRIDTYRELFFNNVESFLSSNFPVLKALLNEAQWFELAQDFFAHHQCESPYFSEIPEEFIDFLHNERNNENDYPFLLELAHYEWVEMALSISKETLPPMVEYINDLLTLPISLSPLAWILAYHYPVHQISSEFLPDEAPEEPTYLIVYRNWADEVHFVQTTAITFRLLQLLEENPHIKVNKLLTLLATELQISDSDLLIENGLETIHNLAEKNIIIY